MNKICRKGILSFLVVFKAGFHLKDVFTSLNVAFVPVSRSRLEQHQIPPLRTFTNILLFCVNFCAFCERFFLKGSVKLRKI